MLPSASAAAYLLSILGNTSVSPDGWLSVSQTIARLCGEGTSVFEVKDRRESIKERTEA